MVDTNQARQSPLIVLLSVDFFVTLYCTLARQDELLKINFDVTMLDMACDHLTLGSPTHDGIVCKGVPTLRNLGCFRNRALQRHEEHAKATLLGTDYSGFVDDTDDIAKSIMLPYTS